MKQIITKTPFEQKEITTNKEGVQLRHTFNHERGETKSIIGYDRKEVRVLRDFLDQYLRGGFYNA